LERLDEAAIPEANSGPPFFPEKVPVSVLSEENQGWRLQQNSIGVNIDCGLGVRLDFGKGEQLGDKGTDRLRGW
jgi:hypothetical protein